MLRSAGPEPLGTHRYEARQVVIPGAELTMRASKRMASIHRRTTIEARRALFDEAAAIIALEYPDRIELNVVARRLATSPRQLQRAFAEAGETSFRTYLRAVRMERAAELLSDSSLRVQDVAEAVGYNQPAQFAKAFRAHHGRPPSALRGGTGIGGPTRALPTVVGSCDR